MPAPALRHYNRNSSVFVLANTEYEVVPAVAAGRAFVISKLSVIVTQACTFLVRPGAGNAALASGVPLNPGEQYTETGLVLLAGEALLASSSVANGLAVNVFGEEVDN